MPKNQKSESAAAADEKPRAPKAQKSSAPPKESAEERRRTRTEVAYLEIADRLADLRFPPGYRFTEAEVAADLGMSKTPVREALLMHVIQGLIIPRPGAGYVVVPITLRDVRGIFKHWRRLAVDATAQVAKSGIDSQVAVQFEESLESLPPIDAHAMVFFDLFVLTDDRFLIRDYTILTIEIHRVLRLVLGEDGAPIMGKLASLISALTANAVDQAQEVLKQHIDDLEDAVLDELMSGRLLQGTNLAAPLT